MDTLIEGKYEVLQKLKEGGMGAVYKVRHRLLDQVRVIKVMRPQIEGDADAQRRFQQEARLATSLKHPNIAELHDFSVDSRNNFYMVIEYIEGVTLAELVASRGALPIATAIDVAEQALRALAYLHKRAVVHRDIAPDNLMVTKGVDGHLLVKLIDLGIAKDTTAEGHTQAGIFLGKLKYASPEQLGALPAGQKLDGRSDLYSLGCVLYQAVTGHSPFKAVHPQDYLIKHLTEPPRPFEETDPGGRVPPELRAAILKALAKKRDDRWASAEEFSAELQRIRADQSGIGARRHSSFRLEAVRPEPAGPVAAVEEEKEEPPRPAPPPPPTRTPSRARITPPPPPVVAEPPRVARPRLDSSTAWEGKPPVTVAEDRGRLRLGLAVAGAVVVVGVALAIIRPWKGPSPEPTPTPAAAEPTAVPATPVPPTPQPTAPPPTATEAPAAPTPTPITFAVATFPPNPFAARPTVRVAEPTARPRATRPPAATPAPKETPRPVATVAPIPPTAAPRPELAESQQHMTAGFRHLSQGDPSGALKEFTRAIELNPKNASARVGRARARYGLSDFDGAIADATAALEINPDEPAALQARGIAKQQKRDYQGAIADYTAIVTLRPREAAAYRYRAVARKLAGDPAGALADERKADELTR